MATPYPSFDELPVDKNGPKYNSWGLYGPNDQLGKLNLLTKEVVLKAAQTQILTGERVSLNWSMFEPKRPSYGRKGIQVKLIRKYPRHNHDDEWSFNTQYSSQWDGFRHYGYQQLGLYYNGVTDEQIAEGPEPNGIHHISKKGIVGRGIFLDYAAYCRANGLKPEIFAKTAVTVDDLRKTWEWQGMKSEDFWEGDILFIRFGYTEGYNNLSDADRDWMEVEFVGPKSNQIGMAPTEDTLRWIWEMKFSAVAGDTRAFEVGSFFATEKTSYHLHPVCLAGWGLPIGELFDLEELSTLCAKMKRYTFFLTSEVMNVPGGVASPPNALAIF